MSIDVVDLHDFYRTPLGGVARDLLSHKLAQRWPVMKGLNLLGLGYPLPYLEPWLRPQQAGAERIVAAMPEKQGVIHWPSHSRSATTLVRTGHLPFADYSFDRILLIHSIEMEDSPQDMLDEVWRVLAPGGSLIAIVPNRRGLWARFDTTPFGYGHPYSRSQLTQVLRHAMFSCIYWSESLFVPPLPRRMMIKSAPLWEKVGDTLSLPFAGVHLVEATKLLHRPIAVRKTKSYQRLAPFLQPASAPMGCKTHPDA